MTVLTTVKSESRPDVSYEIRLSAGNSPYCMCPAWRFSKVIQKDGVQWKAPCKHLKSLGVTELHRLYETHFSQAA